MFGGVRSLRDRRLDGPLLKGEKWRTPSCFRSTLMRSSYISLEKLATRQGAPIVWLSPDHDPNWPLSAPRIGGTPPADDAEMVKLLTTGIWTTGARLRLPMPQFRLDRGDAEAVVAYLKSLTRQE